MSGSNDSTAYGTPLKFAELLVGVQMVVEAQPDEMFAHEMVRSVAHDLVMVLLGRHAALVPVDGDG